MLQKIPPACQDNSLQRRTADSTLTNAVSQLFIDAYNETLSVAAMCVRNEDHSPENS